MTHQPTLSTNEDFPIPITCTAVASSQLFRGSPLCTLPDANIAYGAPPTAQAYSFTPVTPYWMIRNGDQYFPSVGIYAQIDTVGQERIYPEMHDIDKGYYWPATAPKTWPRVRIVVADKELFFPIDINNRYGGYLDLAEFYLAGKAQGKVMVDGNAYQGTAYIFEAYYSADTYGHPVTPSYEGFPPILLPTSGGGASKLTETNTDDDDQGSFTLTADWIPDDLKRAKYYEYYVARMVHTPQVGRYTIFSPERCCSETRTATCTTPCTRRTREMSNGLTTGLQPFSKTLVTVSKTRRRATL